MKTVNQQWADHRTRCAWAAPNDPVYIRYHDEEWGIPVHEDRMLFEMLILECFQAGLSWSCVLHKRDNFRVAFDQFDPRLVARYDENKIRQLMHEEGIIRHEKKIRAAVRNAQVCLKLQSEFGSFDHYLWHWTDGKQLAQTDRTTSPLSDAISGDLKKRGMQFVGSTTIYSYLQAVGVLSGHQKDCFLYRK